MQGVRRLVRPDRKRPRVESDAEQQVVAWYVDRDTACDDAQPGRTAQPRVMFEQPGGLFCDIQNRETINGTLKVPVSFKVITTTSVTRLCFTKTRTARPRPILLVSDRSCPKTDGLGPHH